MRSPARTAKGSDRRDARATAADDEGEVAPTRRAQTVPLEEMLAFPGPDCGFQTTEPWDRPGTLYFYRGPFSSFASFGELLDLPAGYYGHGSGERCVAACRESYFAACKASDRETFDKILAMTPRHAKTAGGPNGIIGALRPDWQHAKYAVMLTAIRAQFRLPAWLPLLMSTGTATICERSTKSDTEWGGWDARTLSYTGRNMLGIALMHARSELRESVLGLFETRGFKRPFLYPKPTTGS
jgi:predicted NAD-dependent protein-ADP-ribosyltransferase YbiA (DUF1768 family)